MMYDQNLIFTKAQSVQWQAVDDGAVLLELDSGHYYTLNEVAVRMWELIDGQRTLGDITLQLLSEFDVAEEEFHNDLSDIIDILSIEKLILADG